MLESLDAFRRALWIALASGLGALAGVFLWLIIWRLLRTTSVNRRRALEAHYTPIVDGLLSRATTGATFKALSEAPAAHRDLIGALLLRLLRVARGDVVDNVRAAAGLLARDGAWMRDLRDRRWWVRAEAARALGLIRKQTASAALSEALEDPNEEVRAAAVESLGQLGDPQAIPLLLQRLRDETRHQRVRVVEALRLMGPAATPRLLEHAAARPDDRALIATVLGQIGGADAVETLVGWMSDPNPEVRAAAAGAAGTLGIDDRGYYHALKALDDESPAVRAMAARALGRSGRADSSRYLERLLDDEWEVAVQAALALRRGGDPGRTALEARAGRPGFGGELAGQMLWELSHGRRV